MYKSKRQLIRGIGIGLILSATVFYGSYRIINTTEKSSLDIYKNSQNAELNTLTKKINEIKNTPTLPHPTKDDVGQESTIETSQEKNSTDDHTSSNESQKVESVIINISYGESSKEIAKKLYDYGLIEDQAAFDYYCMVEKKASLIQQGAFTIPKGSSYAEILEIISK